MARSRKAASESASRAASMAEAVDAAWPSDRISAAVRACQRAAKADGSDMPPPEC